MKTHHTHTTQPTPAKLAQLRQDTLEGMTLLAIGFGCIILLAYIGTSLTHPKK